MPYYFYENRTFGRSFMVHLAGCPQCNHGNVKPRKRSYTIIGRWSGPYDNCQEIKEAAQSAGASIVKCKQCNPCP